jgi:tyrosyl-tRNA synthetase
MSVDRIYENVVDVIPREELNSRLKSGERLRVKLGIDPTAPDIHLGLVVALKKLRQFQDLGHTAVLVIGDYTARVGDPSGRSKSRPVLSPGGIEENTKTYLEQAYLTRATTVARILERDDFSKRYAAGDPITLTELLYPLMQAYDSVAVEADVELGGTDQLYNLLMGRQIMEYYGKKPQCVLTTPLLVGTDGAAKMSKSLGNYIGVAEDPRDVFGKAMSIPDHLMPDYYALLLQSPMPDAPPVEQKRELARSLVRAFHDVDTATSAEKVFDIIARREIPEDIPQVKLPAEAEEIRVVDLITRAGFAKTNSEARRFVRGGAVRLDDELVTDERLSLPTEELPDKVLRVGKRRYARLTAPDYSALQ